VLFYIALQFWEAVTAAGLPFPQLLAKLSKDCLPAEAAAVAAENAGLAAEYAAKVAREKKDKKPEHQRSKPPQYKEASFPPEEWLTTVLTK
jgi:cell division septation protein DedD